MVQRWHQDPQSASVLPAPTPPPNPSSSPARRACRSQTCRTDTTSLLLRCRCAGGTRRRCPECFGTVPSEFGNLPARYGCAAVLAIALDRTATNQFHDSAAPRMVYRVPPVRTTSTQYRQEMLMLNPPHIRCARPFATTGVYLTSRSRPTNAPTLKSVSPAAMTGASSSSPSSRCGRHPGIFAVVEDNDHRASRCTLYRKKGGPRTAQRPSGH